MAASPFYRHAGRSWSAIILVIALALWLAPIEVSAAETRGGQTANVGPAETIDDDLYLAGGTVDDRGTVRGDLIAAGGTIQVTGPVADNVIAAGGTTTLTSRVGPSVRLPSSHLTTSVP